MKPKYTVQLSRTNTSNDDIKITIKERTGESVIQLPNVAALHNIVMLGQTYLDIMGYERKTSIKIRNKRLCSRRPCYTITSDITKDSIKKLNDIYSV